MLLSDWPFFRGPAGCEAYVAEQKFCFGWAIEELRLFADRHRQVVLKNAAKVGEEFEGAMDSVELAGVIFGEGIMEGTVVQEICLLWAY